MNRTTGEPRLCLSEFGPFGGSQESCLESFELLSIMKQVAALGKTINFAQRQQADRQLPCSRSVNVRA
jgi:hypothetical protein